MKYLLLTLLLPLSLAAQKPASGQDSFFYQGHAKCYTYSVGFDYNSGANPARVFILPYGSLDSVKQMLAKSWKAHKQEFSDYYLLAFTGNTPRAIRTLALNTFLRQIDSTRMLHHGSTFLRVYTWHPVNGSMAYSNRWRALSQVSNLYYLHHASDLCRYVRCP